MENLSNSWDLPLTTEALYSIENYQRDVQACKDASEVVSLTAGYFRRLQFFEVNALLLTDGPDWTFRLIMCEPASQQVKLQQQVHEAIRTGSFGWALQQARFVTLPSRSSPDEAPLILHSIGTRSRTSGMFVGKQLRTPHGEEKRPLALLSLILSCMASALENLHLHAQITRQNEQLREMVNEQTQELLKANQALQKEIQEKSSSREALAEEKERLAVTFHSISDAIIAMDTQGTIQMVNPAAENLTGWLEKDATGRTIDQVIVGLRKKGQPLMELPWRTVVCDGDQIRVEQCNLAVKEGEFPVALVLSPINKKGTGRLGVLLVFRDQTEQLLREAEQVKTSKLESLGVLAGGIAHDFNNLLTVILGNLSLAKHLSHGNATTQPCLIESEKACLRARDLTQQLLTFAKGGIPVKKTALLHETIAEATRFALHGSNVLPELDLAADLRPVEADVGQITQVIQNIVLNGSQAMPNGGVLKVRARNARLENGEEHISISIQDHGDGIKPEDLPRIFDPYFTTKQNGNGLGLATCYSIVKNHGGNIRVDSRLGEGATFQVNLPASKRGPLRPTTQSPNEPSTSKGRILVMDDDESMRHLLDRLLRQLGHSVHATRDGTEAIAAYRDALGRDERFDLVILDLTIPGGMGGRETMAELKLLDPAVVAIVSSGYTSDPVMAEFDSFGFSAVVPKPYSLHDLKHAVQTVLAGEKQSQALL